MIEISQNIFEIGGDDKSLTIMTDCKCWNRYDVFFYSVRNVAGNLNSKVVWYMYWLTRFMPAKPVLKSGEQSSPSFLRIDLGNRERVANELLVMGCHDRAAVKYGTGCPVNMGIIRKWIWIVVCSVLFVWIGFVLFVFTCACTSTWNVREMCACVFCCCFC